jgi:hypothetical protein
MCSGDLAIGADIDYDAELPVLIWIAYEPAVDACPKPRFHSGPNALHIPNCPIYRGRLSKRDAPSHPSSLLRPGWEARDRHRICECGCWVGRLRGRWGRRLARIFFATFHRESLSATA